MRPRKQTYTLKMYLDKIQEDDICNDADVQRNFVWKPEQINELMVTVLTDDYIPPIILGEEDNTQLHIADGGQRSAALKLYRYGNYKITSSIEEPVISYKKKMRDEDGNIVWEDAEFNIKNKTFEQLPDELKKKFDEYQIETVIHENCDRYKISKYIKRYNNTSSMNAAQKAFTYVYNYAECVRKILDKKFFIDHSAFTESEKTKGTVERVVMETVMCMFHLDDWKSQAKKIAAYLNDNSSENEFKKLEDNLCRLENIIADDVKDIFTSKDSFIWLTLFDRFTKLNVKDSLFSDFLMAFKNRLKYEKVDGAIFEDVDKNKGTKDKTIILKKLHILETLMNDYLQSVLEEKDDEDLKTVEKCIGEEIGRDDFDFFKTLLNDYSVEVDSKSALLDEYNRPSLIAIVGHACQEEKDGMFSDWLIKFFKENNTYLKDQKENYLYMKKDFDGFVTKQEMGIA